MSSRVIKAQRFGFPSEEDYRESLKALTESNVRQAGGGGSEEHSKNASVVAEDIIEQAKRQAEAIRKEAFEKGLAEGLAKAKEAEMGALGEVIDNFRKTLLKLASMREEILKESEMEIVDLSLEVARKIIGAELYNDPETVTRVIRTAFERIGASDDLTVRLNPADHELLSASPPEFLEKVQLKPDPAVERGGAIIETDGGRLDA